MTDHDDPLAPGPESQPPKAGDIVRGRYLLPEPGSGKLVSWTRCTTLVSLLDASFGIDQWKMRLVALGLAKRPDLLSAIAPFVEVVSIGEPHPQELRDLVDEAAVEGGINVASARGTWLHDQTEIADRCAAEGVDWEAHVAAEAHGDVRAYRHALAAYGLQPVAVEQLMSLRIGSEGVAGKIDRVLLVTREITITLPGVGSGAPPRMFRLYPGEYVIGDVKTGRTDLGQAKIAGQIAVYSRGQFWHCPPDYEPEPVLYGIRTDFGLVLHLPFGSGVCTVEAVDLEAGWEGANRSAAVRASRRIARSAIGTAEVTKAEDIAARRAQWVRALQAADSHADLTRVATLIRESGDLDDHLIAAGRERRADLYRAEAHAS